jgi:hypothetical protein
VNSATAFRKYGDASFEKKKPPFPGLHEEYPGYEEALTG